MMHLVGIKAAKNEVERAQKVNYLAKVISDYDYNG